MPLDDSRKLRCGDIFYVKPFDTDSMCLQMKTGRFGLIISDESRNRHTGTVLMVFLSHTRVRNQNIFPIKTVFLGDSAVIADHIFTVDKSFLQSYKGRLPARYFSQLSRALRYSMPLMNADQEDITYQLDKAQRDAEFYKNAYFKLLDERKEVHNK